VGDRTPERRRRAACWLRPAHAIVPRAPNRAEAGSVPRTLGCGRTAAVNPHSYVCARPRNAVVRHAADRGSARFFSPNSYSALAPTIDVDRSRSPAPLSPVARPGWTSLATCGPTSKTPSGPPREDRSNRATPACGAPSATLTGWPVTADPGYGDTRIDDKLTDFAVTTVANPRPPVARRGIRTRTPCATAGQATHRH
jgi:hypothetical protein